MVPAVTITRQGEGQRRGREGGGGGVTGNKIGFVSNSHTVELVQTPDWSTQMEEHSVWQP